MNVRTVYSLMIVHSRVKNNRLLCCQIHTFHIFFLHLIIGYIFVITDEMFSTSICSKLIPRM